MSTIYIIINIIIITAYRKFKSQEVIAV